MDGADDGGGAEREIPMPIRRVINHAADDVNDQEGEDDDDEPENPAFRAYEDDEPLEAILSIMEEDPSVVQVWDGRGWSFLHNLVDARPRPTLPGVVRRVLEVWPISVREWTKSVTFRFLPLHLACQLKSEEVTDEEEEFRSEAIRIMVAAWPGSVQKRSSRGKYPLELAVGARKLSVIRCLVDTWPQAIEQAYRNGTMLLHKATCDAFGDDEMLDVIRYLLEKRPESIRDVDFDGRLALHNAIAETSVGVVTYLADTWQEALKVRCRDRMLPIHVAVIACAYEFELPMVQCLVHRWPPSLRKEINNRWLPLHLALWHWPSDPWVLEGVRFLVEQNPESVNEATEEGYLPLHIAAGRDFRLTYHDYENDAAQTELALVRYLYELAPASVRVASRDGSLPLHCAARTGYSIPAAQFLVEQHREVIHIGNHEGITPLLTALSRNVNSTELGFEEPHRFFEPRASEPSTELVRLLVNQRLVEEDHRGPSPLHFAIAHGQPLDVLRCLVEHHPTSLLRKDKHGLLAIHAAVARDPPLMDLVQLIVAERPEAVKDTDNHGSTPLHVAVAQKEPSLDLVRFLVEQPFPTVQARDGRGLLPLQVAAESDAPLELLYWLTKACPEAVYGGRPRTTLDATQRSTRTKHAKQG